MFYNNLRALDRFNKTCAKKICDIDFEKTKNRIALVKNDDGELLVTKNNLPVDDVKNPYLTAKENVNAMTLILEKCSH